MCYLIGHFRDNQQLIWTAHKGAHMTSVYIIGAGMTPFGSYPDMSLKAMVRAAVEGALNDAACSTDMIEAIFFSNVTQGVLEGQVMIPGQISLRPLGFQGIPVVNIENACASGSTALYQAIKELRSGDSEVVMALGAEKMVYPDKSKVLSTFDGAMDIHNKENSIKTLLNMAEGFASPYDREANTGAKSIFMEVYAAIARHHMQTFGTTRRQLAAVSSKNHFHSTKNALSQFRKPFSIDEVLAARTIAWPLTLPMCSPVSDGAACAILCSEGALSRFDKSRAVRIESCVLATGSDRSVSEPEKHLTRQAALNAYNQAGIGPGDISVAEVHDATAAGEIIQIENLGFCDFGKGGPFSESGATTLGGRIPVNPSGGLESKGHPLGATGLGQVYELVAQLRGEAAERQVPDARFAMAENGGGVLGIEEAVACITILGKPNN